MNATIFYLTSGLFLGWSLGANDAANFFGTAVGSKVIKFKHAATIMSIFVILGAVISGSGASHTLGKLGAISALPGAFIVALAAATTILIMTNRGLPVSTSQAIVGAIIGWNIFTGSPTDYSTLTKILMTWILCPLLSAIFAIIFYRLLKVMTKKMKTNLFIRHMYIKIGLIVVGAFGGYSLGANNIANVMGVFTKTIKVTPLTTSLFTFTETQTLFLLGGIAIAVGIFTYSKRVMATVGKTIYKLSPATALVVVMASSTVLFIFASTSLQSLLMSLGLPTIPLVPVSSSQAVVGAIIGLGIGKGDRNINYKKLGGIALGWLMTPTFSLIISYISLFFMQNVFQQVVH